MFTEIDKPDLTNQTGIKVCVAVEEVAEDGGKGKVNESSTQVGKKRRDNPFLRRALRQVVYDLTGKDDDKGEDDDEDDDDDKDKDKDKGDDKDKGKIDKVYEVNNLSREEAKKLSEYFAAKLINILKNFKEVPNSEDIRAFIIRSVTDISGALAPKVINRAFNDQHNLSTIVTFTPSSSTKPIVPLLAAIAIQTWYHMINYHYTYHMQRSELTFFPI